MLFYGLNLVDTDHSRDLMFVLLVLRWLIEFELRHVTNAHDDVLASLGANDEREIASFLRHATKLFAFLQSLAYMY